MTDEWCKTQEALARDADSPELGVPLWVLSLCWLGILLAAAYLA